ncbi:hypothetical protein CPAST_c25950 [Clostridium pasteurianum DSM 525 = ATCC 6013]|uniref:Uncharacterized protein n=1 Tax=Clostridium pasteurianum DSM 525 = ATCC 6013 TaxID=1262449 RepID=A0A0H3J5B7_CLOPA|nr:hypothetical protein [Clostridium pasteurianum]AJA48664.1 hypothetical protein CPAST_c25950 [Clostridium pasteurianum DSM 525 = ATCC 6013]AJA52652.1 hypothetical protein CLPA_c25950 [Clostridium pasteurianum DSM 525 = ATCC 6013]AOZ75892.1 hypothetical protein AQ983_12615 [Clostridium pasteurianum DSM 525 = ATCC 6013]AOZ79688.1 hypothetical protein AQ984_12610 [Clostridium pasteurianum]ELP59964.1 hypothetical protein F502_04992 [Clostridium pasteurianum DSM 525 = ATCC 6013]
MFEDLYDTVKKELLIQKDMNGVSKVYRNYEYSRYFHIYTYKYFSKNPKKKDQKLDYNNYYREIRNKSNIDTLSNNFNTTYNTYLNISEDDKLYDSNIEDLEMIIAKYEIAVGKIICLSEQIKEYNCSKDDVIEYMKIRDLMYENVNSIKHKTVEYRRMMWD